MFGTGNPYLTARKDSNEAPRCDKPDFSRKTVLKKKKRIGGLSENIKTKSLNLKRNTGLVSYRGRPTGTAGYTVGIIHTKNKQEFS